MIRAVATPAAARRGTAARSEPAPPEPSGVRMRRWSRSALAARPRHGVGSAPRAQLRDDIVKDVLHGALGVMKAPRDLAGSTIRSGRDFPASPQTLARRVGPFPRHRFSSVYARWPRFLAIRPRAARVRGVDLPDRALFRMRCLRLERHRFPVRRLDELAQDVLGDPARGAVLIVG
jgi:hypothetical protein